MNVPELSELIQRWFHRGIESARPDLAHEVREHIPPRLAPHRLGAINIIVDLRASRVAAAAVIVVGVLILGALFSGGHLYKDGVLLVNYYLLGGREDVLNSDVLAGLAALSESLREQGRDVVYYGDKVKHGDPYAVLMYWRLPDGKYSVVLGDLTARTVSPQTLIRLQARMIQEGTR